MLPVNLGHPDSDEESLLSVANEKEKVGAKRRTFDLLVPTLTR
jgi:hypothetical protein